MIPRLRSTFVVASVLVIFSMLRLSEGSLMGRGSGIFLDRHHDDHAKPWDAGRKNYPQYYYDLWQQEEEEREYRRRLLAQPFEHEDGSKPCVGLCYHKKKLALKAKEAAEARQNEVLPEEVVIDELSTSEPCIGICQYYRNLGQENPYSKKEEEDNDDGGNGGKIETLKKSLI